MRANTVECELEVFVPRGSSYIGMQANGEKSASNELLLPAFLGTSLCYT
jgi:hypothetical protein